MPTKGEGVSAFGFKAYGGGQGLQKWDKGIQTILATDSHPAALAPEFARRKPTPKTRISPVKPTDPNVRFDFVGRV
jgi:hypothetical protein